MAITHDRITRERPPLRLWPGVTAVLLLWLLWLVAPLVVEGGFFYSVMGGVLFGLVVLVWWLFFSRAQWLERIVAIVVMVGAVFGMFGVVHPSISNGMMGGMLPIFSIPLLCAGLVGWAAISHRVRGPLRIPSMVAVLVLAAGVMAFLRTDGIRNNNADLRWRWTPDAEERLLARGNDDPVAPPVAPVAAEAPKEVASSPAPAVAASPEVSVSEPSAGATAAAPIAKAEWPGFRGADRDGVVRGVRIDTDWSKKPPVGLWRKPIGPGWSSFAVRGNVIYTQEQRGEDEVVAAYSLTTGEPVWRHRDAARFWESNGGAGPRGTPTLGDDGRVYSFGGTGILNALDGLNGKTIWSRNAASEMEAAVPDWGFSSSPVVIDDLVVIAVGGQLAAYERESGKPLWRGPAHGFSYSSPHLLTIDGVTQILLPNASGMTSVALDGAVLWEHEWPAGAIVQPARLADGDVLLSVVGGGVGGTGGAGIRRISVSHTSGKWTTQERWTSSGLKPFFNDYVIHNGHAYGFDGTILASIDLNDGRRTWKGGRYGSGQMVLLADQDLLLVSSEEGEVALVRATPDQFTEVARFKAIEGKTWNHPVVVGDVLLIRNGEEMAAFRLPRAGP
jgi:outer membrane protein assembly factor BamB